MFEKQFSFTNMACNVTKSCHFKCVYAFDRLVSLQVHVVDLDGIKLSSVTNPDVTDAINSNKTEGISVSKLATFPDQDTLIDYIYATVRSVFCFQIGFTLHSAWLSSSFCFLHALCGLKGRARSFGHGFLAAFYCLEYYG